MVEKRLQGIIDMDIRRSNQIAVKTKLLNKKLHFSSKFYRSFRFLFSFIACFSFFFRIENDIWLIKLLFINFRYKD